MLPKMQIMLIETAAAFTLALSSVMGSRLIIHARELNPATHDSCGSPWSAAATPTTLPGFDAGLISTCFTDILNAIRHPQGSAGSSPAEENNNRRMSEKLLHQRLQSVRSLPNRLSSGEGSPLESTRRYSSAPHVAKQEDAVDSRDTTVEGGQEQEVKLTKHRTSKSHLSAV